MGAAVQTLDDTVVGTDVDTLRADLAEQGCLLFRDLVDTKLIAELRADILHALDGCGWIEAGSDPLAMRPSEPKREESGPGWWPGYRAIQSLESFHRLAHDPAIVQQLQIVFGADVIVHPRKIARVIYPQHDLGQTPPHQDFPLVGGTVDFFTLWLPLADTPRERGGLRVLLGSHRDGLQQMDLYAGKTGAGAVGTTVDDDDPRWATVDYRAGDALLFHSLLVHAGLPNTTDRLRVSVDYRYQPAGEPLTTWSMRPHFYEKVPDIPDWDEFTGGWETTRWVDAPGQAEVVDEMPVLATGRLEANAGAHGGQSRFADTSAFVAQFTGAR